MPPEHLARFVVDIVEQLDLKSIYKQYGPVGGKAIAPEILLGLLFYGYATGTFSSRKIEQATYESIPFRYIAGGTEYRNAAAISFPFFVLNFLSHTYFNNPSTSLPIPRQSISSYAIALAAVTGETPTFLKYLSTRPRSHHHFSHILDPGLDLLLTPLKKQNPWVGSAITTNDLGPIIRNPYCHHRTPQRMY